jgi:hypothetical protein
MTELEYDPMNDTPPPPGGSEGPRPGAGRSAVAWIAVPIAAAVGFGLMYYLRPKAAELASSPPPAPTSSARAAEATAPVPVPSTAPPAERVVPALGESDPFIRSLAAELFGSSDLDSWLARGDELVARGVGAALAVAEKRSARKFFDFLPFEGRFAVAGGKARGPIAPESFRRYDRFVAVFAALDAGAIGRFLAIVDPLVTQVLDETAFPGTLFSERLAVAVEHLLATPLPQGAPEVAVGEDGVYRFTDPALEALSAPQKQLLRLGPENGARVRASLRELAAALPGPPR